MNEEVIKLIEQLAQKLGTTSEYLWSVLLTQAQISAIMSLSYVIFCIISGLILLKFHLNYSKIDDDGYSKYDDYKHVQIIMIISSLIWVTLFILAIFNIENIITGFINPEYWALSEILHQI